jgi:hypothetical protein
MTTHRGPAGPGALWGATFVIGLLTAGAGCMLQSVETMAVGSLLAAVGYGLRDYFAPQPDSMGPFTVYAMIFGSWMGLGHLLGSLFIDTEYAELFYTFAVPEFMFEAQILATLIVVIPLISYRGLLALRASRLTVRLPSVGFETSDTAVVAYCVVLMSLSWGVRVGLLPGETALGTLNTFLGMGSYVAIFILSWHWASERCRLPRWTWYLVVVAMTVDSIHALLFSYMRGRSVYPFLAYFLALFIRKAIRRRHLAAGALIVLAISFVYYPLSELRQHKIDGTERLSMLTEPLVDDDASTVRTEDRLDWRILALVGRGSNFSQLTQVVRIAEEDGFYWGETMSYMAYAFIPRVVWPEKPEITPTQWFASRIGSGRRLDDGRWSNAVNLSLGGDLYLNFGWFGTVLGLPLLALVMGTVWESAKLFDYENNPVGQTLALALLVQATQSSSAAGLPQLLFLYLVSLAISHLLRHVIPVMSWRPGSREVAGTTPR